MGVIIKMKQTKFESLITDYISMKPEVKSIIGYGSAIKKQANDDDSEKQIDLIIGVEDEIFWHRLNNMLNPEDYSKKGIDLMLKHPKLFNWGTAINFLTYLPYKNNSFKIGIVEYDKLIEDLTTWKSAYLSGRLQKAIEIVQIDPKLDAAIKKNRENALRVALMLLPEEKHNLNDLYFQLCSLSYFGDIRMYFKMENPNKVKNISNGSFKELHEIYSEVNKDFYTLTGDIIHVNKELLIDQIEELPSSLLNYITKHNFDFNNLSIDQLNTLQNLIKAYLKQSNLRSSTIQPIKGILINGIQKTKKYAEHKQRKSKQK